MKLQHKIAGTILLPLAAATMATSVQAADHDVDVYGRIQVHVTETTVDPKDMDFGATAGQSRLGFKVKNDQNVMGHFEYDWTAAAGAKTAPRLRHAYLTFDGITVGQTWTPSATVELLYPVLDPNANALSSAPSARTGQVSTKIDAGSAQLTVGVYDAGVAESAVPGLAAKAVADMGGLKVIGAFDMTQDAGDDTKKGSTQITAGVVADMGGMTLKGAFTTVSDSYTALGGSLSMPMSDGMSFNAAFDQYTPESGDDATAIWANVKTKTASGVDLGAEYSMLGEGYNAHHAAATASDTSVIRLMANYNF